MSWEPRENRKYVVNRQQTVKIPSTEAIERNVSPQKSSICEKAVDSWLAVLSVMLVVGIVRIGRRKG